MYMYMLKREREREREREDLATLGVRSDEKTFGVGVGNNEKERRF